jgi:hypothetical protein
MNKIPLLGIVILNKRDTLIKSLHLTACRKIVAARIPGVQRMIVLNRVKSMASNWTGRSKKSGLVWLYCPGYQPYSFCLYTHHSIIPSIRPHPPNQYPCGPPHIHPHFRYSVHLGQHQWWSQTQSIILPPKEKLAIKPYTKKQTSMPIWL